MKMRYLAALFVCSSALAHDLGDLGTVYEIAETDLLVDLQQQVQRKVDSGELKKRHEQWRDDVQAKADRPKGIALPQAQAYRSFEIDPTYTVPDDIQDHTGAVLYPKGYTFNPLEIKPLTQVLYFIDAGVPEQIEWLQSHCPKAYSCRRILVNGSVKQAREALKERVYFDQGGFLSQYFRLAAVPAVVRQSGAVLHVEEFAL